MSKKKTEKESDRLRKLLKEALAKEKAEAKFQAASPAEKRVLIAKDVLAQMATKRIRPIYGKWLDGMNVLDKYGNVDFSKQLDQSIKDSSTGCSACAAGAIFACAVLRKDAITVGEAGYDDDGGGVYDGGNIWSYLRGIFPAEMLDRIETAFEMDGGAQHAGEKYASFKPGIKSPNGRMKAIMQNIIKNRGEFVVD
jgi:hypothetical protein